MDAIRVFAPDIAMIDMSMPGLNGLEVLASIRAEGHATRVLFLTATLTSAQILDRLKQPLTDALILGI
jgi:DNA-binding NarL/FixJ family response regulator